MSTVCLASLSFPTKTCCATLKIFAGGSFKYNIVQADGDAVLILINPGASFAVWEDVYEDESANVAGQYLLGEGQESALQVDVESVDETTSQRPLSKKERKKRQRERQQRQEQERQERHQATENSIVVPETGQSEPIEETSILSTSLFGGVDHVVSQEAEETRHESCSKANPSHSFGQLEGVEKDNITYLVSSRHLTLASATFKSRLARDGWMEGQRNEIDGMHHLDVRDWDPEALLILLNVLHVQNAEVPRSVTLEMLAKIALLVYDYRCRRALEVFADIWIQGTRISHPVPSAYCRDLILWMFVAWVFKLPEEFSTTTCIAVRQCNTPTICNMNIPIPNPILSAIEHRRCQALEKAFSTLDEWLLRFRSNAFECSQDEGMSFTCGSMFLGALTKNMSLMGCLDTRPEAPFDEWSFESLCNAVAHMKFPVWWSETTGGYGNRYRSVYGSQLGFHDCGLETTVKESVSGIKSELAGLDLKEFKDRGEGEFP